ncbi:hypothetical protein DFS33DRAFT_1278965 [Desarmillaria ectypa]|nr:hypothetical protein DFS33DRAFT_1278965 [Desarmillaria ectypa]
MSLSRSCSPSTRAIHTPSGSPLRCPECRSVLPGKSIAPALLSSRLKELSSCNDVPLDSERTALEAVVREGESNLSSLPQRIAAVRETLKILLKEQTRTVKHITNAKTLLNPVRRLPADVLIEIFTACLPEHMDSLDAKSAPWILSQVCASWRQIALESARLWAHIQLEMDSYTNHTGCVFRLGTVLHRAGMHPLRIRIMGRRDFSDHPVFAMILSTSLRWTFLNIIAPLRAFRLFNSISHCLPLLVSLDIKVLSVRQSEIQPGSAGGIFGFRQAPRLQELTLTQTLVSDGSFFSHLFALPSTRISLLNMVTTTSDVVSLLRSDRAEHVTSCAFTLPDSERHIPPQVPVIRRDCIKCLIVLDLSPGLLSRLHLPALQRLILIFSKRPILTMSEHTAPNLTELTIVSDHPVDGRALAIMLQWTPNLISMTLETILKTETLFIALGISTDGVFELVPRLKMISLEGTQLKFSDYGRVITDMVEARRAISSGKERAALKEVRLKNELGDPECWEKLRKGGLKVRYAARM